MDKSGSPGKARTCPNGCPSSLNNKMSVRSIDLRIIKYEHMRRAEKPSRSHITVFPASRCASSTPNSNVMS